MHSFQELCDKPLPPEKKNISPGSEPREDNPPNKGKPKRSVDTLHLHPYNIDNLTINLKIDRFYFLFLNFFSFV